MMSFLSDAIQSWTVEDIMRDDLNKNKVKPIPSKFRSAQQFFDIHSEFLIEEVRATLKESILDIRKSQILNVSAKEVSASVLFLDIDLRKARSTDDGCIHIANDLDIFLLSCECPVASNLKTEFCCLGMAIDIGRDNCYQKSFKVLVSKNKIRFKRFKCAKFLTNISVKMKISKALSFHDKRSDAIEAYLKFQKTIHRRCRSCDKFGSLSKDIPEDYRTMECVVSKVSCTHSSHAEIVWTPPGSGHDLMISHITKELVNHGDRVLICFPTAASIWDFINNLDENSSLGDILVLNNNSELENNNTFGKASLGKRSHELYCSLILWKSWMKEMRCLLDLSGYYHVFCAQPNECTICSNEGLLNFSLISFLERFDNIVRLLQGCLECMLKEVSIISLSDSDARKASELLDIIRRFDRQLHNQGLIDENVQLTFGLHGVPEKNIEDDTEKKLNATRIDCLNLLDALLSCLKLPQPNSREEVDKFCIIHSRVIVSTPDCASQLCGVKMKPFQALIVGHAGLINESELLIPLDLPVVNVVLLGDHQHRQPALKSKLCQEFGYGTSLFQRFRSPSSKTCMLKTLYTVNPLVSDFIKEHFYGRRIVNSKDVTSPEYNQHFRNTRYPEYSFLEVPVLNNLGHIGNVTAQSAAIMALLESLYADTSVAVVGTRLKIGVICLSINDADAVRSQLTSKHKSHDNIILEVKSIDSLQLERFDLTILSTVVQDYTELKLVKDTSINVALTSSRHLCWVFGKSEDLISSKGIWRKLIIDARNRELLKCLDEKLFSEAIQKLELNDEDSGVDKSAFPKEKLCRVGQETTWVGRPHNTKFILGPVLDQKGECDSCTIQASKGTVESINKYQYACFKPPQDFNWNLSYKDFKDKYKKKVGEELSEEENTKKKGKQRLTTNLEILKEDGVFGSNGVESEDRVFKISSYSELKKKDTEPTNYDVQTIMRDLMHGDIMPCHFRLSKNYFYLQPGEVYQYDEKKPYIHPKSGLPVSHAVMMVGGGQLPLPHAVHDTPRATPRVRVHTIMQNSEGEGFGIGGIGKVLTRSLTGIYHVKI